MPLQLCPDPVITKLRQIFQANILRVPEERFQPLSAILRSGGNNRYWGSLSKMIEGDLLDTEDFVTHNRMADVSGKISRSAEIDVGLDILGGFLRGFQLPSATICAEFSGATTASFSFNNVQRKYIEPSDLDSLLVGLPLNSELGATRQIIAGEARLYVIDSIITSSDFSIHVNKENDTDFKLDVPAISKLVGEASADVSVQKTSETAIRFKGEKSLTFAFSCLYCEADRAGRITLKASSLPKNVFETRSLGYERTLLTEEAEMMEF